MPLGQRVVQKVEPKYIPINERFNRSVYKGSIVQLHDELYLKGDMGYFRLGKVQGDNTVDLILHQFPFNSRALSRLITDKVKATGVKILVRDYPPKEEWPWLYARPEGQA